MIHIASEIVVVIGLTFYFNQKNKKLMSHIEDLSQRIEEQEDILQKHEKVIRKLLDFINQSESKHQQPKSQSEYQPQQVQTKHKKIEKEIKPAKSVLSKPEPKVTFKEEEQPRKLNPPPPPRPPPPPPKDEDEDEDEDSDLDAELAEELKELVSSDPEQIIKVDTDLKKRSR